MSGIGVRHHEPRIPKKRIRGSWCLTRLPTVQRNFSRGTSRSYNSRSLMSGAGLGLSDERGFAPCPQCHQLIDSSSESCRFCGSSLDRTQLQQAAAVHRRMTEAKSRANNRRALIAGIIGLVATVLAYAAWVGLKFWIRFERDRP